MSKIHYEYISTSNSKVIVIKSINFDVNVVSDIIFNSQIHYLETTYSISSFTKSNYFLGDYYLIIRNDSSPINATLKYIEEAYQFVG